MADVSPDQLAYSRLNGRYQLVSLIGRGAMASVYQARDEFLGRDVAVKLFNSPVAERDSASRQEQELATLARLNHHSLVGLLDAGIAHLVDESQSCMFLVMELVRGSTLRARIARQTMTAREIARMGAELAEGLEYIHQHGVIHRDIKPGNILMVEYTETDNRPRAKLADFGIALIAGTLETNVRGSTTGTAAYLSPEQARGETVTDASDIYSLGLVLLECFTRALAFPGSSVQSATGRLLRDPSIPSDLPPGWVEILSAMTARDKVARPDIRDVVMYLHHLSAPELARHKADDTLALPHTEAGRLSALHRYEILDTPPDGAFDRITALAARLLRVPIAIVSVVDHDRIWFKSQHGLPDSSVEREAALCISAMVDDALWVVEDAPRDLHAMASLRGAGERGIRFSAGVPLRTHDGHNLGILCVLGYEPREISNDETRTLEDLASLVMGELELRLATRRALRFVGVGS